MLDNLGRKAEVVFNFSLQVLSGRSLHEVKQAWCGLGEFLPPSAGMDNGAVILRINCDVTPVSS